ncbi:hypothetical protein BJV82DRAFT_672445 [Fennellomyces sp. T-0311]|nr:hypothetical protein BJV82DRAFT_672445 [Fennellomyces sp. T-0311]
MDTKSFDPMQLLMISRGTTATTAVLQQQNVPPLWYYWAENDLETWSLLNYDIALVEKKPDVSKDSAHRQFSKELQILEANCEDAVIVDRLKQLERDFKTRHRNNAVTEFWDKLKTSISTEAIKSRIQDAKPRNAVTAAIAASLQATHSQASSFRLKAKVHTRHSAAVICTQH